LYISLMAVCLVLYDLGFRQNIIQLKYINLLYTIFLILLIGTIIVKYILNYQSIKLKLWVIDGLYLVFALVILFSSKYFPLTDTPLIELFENKFWLFFAFIVSLVRELAAVDLNLKYRKTNPALLFVISFAVIIFSGTFLLLLPRATYAGISFTDALFTSTSAVCVTGLVVVDTGSYFTLFGQTIVLGLIQLGGLGIMTFASFFTLFLRGGASYQNLIMLGNLTSVSKITEVWATLKKIIIFTLLIEAFGTVIIYLNLGSHNNMDEDTKLFFSIFHSVSAFCNAGFSTLENSFYDISFRFSYSLHLIIAFLFIIGGLGFPVVINLFAYLKHLIFNRVLRINKQRAVLYKARVINLNTRLVFYTTLILIICGTALFYLLEYNNTLAEHHGTGKVVSAFFGAVTPRTAGFNTVDTSGFYMTTTMLVVFLMWIGASPASTGGGIKTSTFALAVLNVIALAKGRNRLEINRREIPVSSINRAFAFVFLSIFIIGIMIFSLMITDSDKIFADLLFEVFSAFSTVGLSRGITGDLSLAGKYIIIFTMYIGRVGALSLLVAFFRRTKTVFYQYPEEGVLIN
ncbi:MAG: potassium transporter TrkG, partial [Bacteroidales bacterium]|nr:potassium transporter TrkG [Bacteroidales bacterium]